MATLFDELEEMQNPETSLQIVAKDEQVLTKTQIDFNKIIVRVEKLENDLIKRENKLNNILQYYNENAFPLDVEFINLYSEFSFALDEVSKKHKFPRSVKNLISEIIIASLREVFTEQPPTKEQEELYNAWSETTFQEEVEEQKNIAKSMFSEFMGFDSDFDIDLENLDLDDPENEGFKKLREKFEEQFENKNQEQKNTKSKKKTKKQLEREEMLKAEEELKTKNIRSIYISLTKILHPDVELNPVLKQEKEKIIKQVIVAYEEKDLSTLLKLEMEWVYKTTEYLSELSDKKLKTYISVMRERANQLDAEKFKLLHHPRYESIFKYCNLQEKQAIKHINKDIIEVQSHIKQFQKDIDYLRNTTNRDELIAFINKLYDNIEEEYFLF